MKIFSSLIEAIKTELLFADAIDDMARRRAGRAAWAAMAEADPALIAAAIERGAAKRRFAMTRGEPALNGARRALASALRRGPKELAIPFSTALDRISKPAPAKLAIAAFSEALQDTLADGEDYGSMDGRPSEIRLRAARERFILIARALPAAGLAWERAFPEDGAPSGAPGGAALEPLAKVVRHVPDRPGSELRAATIRALSEAPARFVGTLREAVESRPTQDASWLFGPALAASEAREIQTASDAPGAASPAARRSCL